MSGKKDPEAEKKTEILDWIEAVLGPDSKVKVDRSQPFEKVLKDGIVLCALINKMVPGSVKRVNTKGGGFALMENLAAFQKAIKAYGVPEEEIFQTVDLFEARNIKAVVMCLLSLGRTAQDKGYDGPVIGPKMSHGNKRDFTEEQIRQGRDAHLSLQYSGSNKGATQAGINMGKPRSVHD